MKILVSGFEPFGGRDVNSSREFALAVANQVQGCESVILPVVFEDAYPVLEKKIKSVQPEIVLAFGEAEKAKKLQFEYSGLNLQSSTLKDNAGLKPHLETIDPNQGHGLFSSWNRGELDRLVAEIPEFELSFYAGTYVCNRLLFDLLRNERELGVKAAFIHVPLFDKLEQESLDLESAVRAMIRIIETVKV